MKKREALLDEVKSEKRPTAAENAKISGIAAEFTARLDKALTKAKVKAKAIVGGSGAKGTWLRGMHDIDVFVCFDYSRYKEKNAELSEFLAAAVKKAFPKHERLHGSRDYFKIAYEGYSFEIVPILGIKTARQAMNITDASLLHAGWVQKETRKKKGLGDEIRLTKAFCKAQRVYGAESHVRGFSGYSCEILTTHYGSFLQLLVAATKDWKRRISKGTKIIVDAEKHYKGRDPLRELNEAKVQSELIVIDPIQKDRNATAALSNETLSTFISAAEKFLKEPSKAAFEKESITAESLAEKAKGKNLTIVEATPHRGKEDVVGARLLKAHEHIEKRLRESGFKLTDTGWAWEKGSKALYWYTSEAREPEPETRDGPPISNTVHAEKFRQEHSGKKGRQVFEKNGRLYAKIERSYKKPEQLVKAIVEEDAYVMDKAAAYEIKRIER
ncbi:CCA tRNA nucleotidyltransferase [Candidatus Woesearchaeota archaeon]|nr:CCA tRNA nucleotidyltransferase [Candidatus Woesearchaeota archaeon]